MDAVNFKRLQNLTACFDYPILYSTGMDAVKSPNLMDAVKSPNLIHNNHPLGLGDFTASIPLLNKIGNQSRLLNSHLVYELVTSVDC